MGTATLLSVEQYLATSFSPDCDLVDGVPLERNMGEMEHSDLQGEILGWFRDRRARLQVKAFPELRIQVKADRFRIPDVTVVELPVPRESVLKTPPYICIEVLSPEDTLNRMKSRIDDYIDMGISNVWVVDPLTRCAWSASRSGLAAAVDGVLRTSDARIEMPIGELFQA